MIQLLDACVRFHRDTCLGRIYHAGTRSYREMRTTDSLHVVIDGDRISMHIDRISPVKRRPDGSAHYTMSRVVAHNLAGRGNGVTRRKHRRFGDGDGGGDVRPEHSFVFRSPEGRLNLGAHNLKLFTLLAAGVDDDTWLDHLQRGDYSRWFDHVIGDDTLTQVALDLEEMDGESAEQSRREIIKAIAKRYPLSA
ncbi:MAG TPA: hypothetical protein VHT75_05750 [Acidimicrobiales bacterium]|nr:hypothetical protein [Acidimicrobiales bacterium]